MPSEDPDRAPLGRSSVLVFAVVMVAGAVALQLAHRYFNLGPIPGNLLFVALPTAAVPKQ